MTRLRQHVGVASVLVCAACLASPGRGQEPAGINWVRGPATALIEDYAEIQVPEGYVFTGKKGTIELMHMMGNLITEQEAGFLAPETFFEKGAQEPWFVVFEFNPIGYVKDDEKDAIDSQKLLQNMQEGIAASNKERAKKGYPAMEVVGWAVEPHYDQETNNLEWGLQLRTSNGDEVVNYEVRLLGRDGVMQSTLVLDPAQLNSALPQFRQLLETYTFKSGQQYAEYKPGDKIAKIGLTALIAGGAVAIAAKTGLLKYIWKYIIFIVIAVVAFFKKFFTRYFGKRETID